MYEDILSMMYQSRNPIPRYAHVTWKLNATINNYSTCNLIHSLFQVMSSLIGLFNGQCRSLLWLRSSRRWYHGAGCYGHASNKGLTASNEVLTGDISYKNFTWITFYTTVGEDILANRIREPNLWQLVQAYRDHGHCMASLDPLTTPSQWALLTKTIC